ncbi:MAG: NAD(P)H-hydrate dehydratase [Patescibacteria group bacterium]
MSSVIKKSEVAKIFPHRNPKSHKGDNGRVLIIGGSVNYFGAPVLAGLGALNSGADLVYLLVPECNFDVSRSFYPDFIVRKYPGNFLNSRVLDNISELLDKVDAVLIGPGLSEEVEILRTVTLIIKKAKCPIILDAEAIPAIAQLGLIGDKTGYHENLPEIIITPHRNEMNELLEGETLPEDTEEQIKAVEDFAKKWNVTVLLKGHMDIIASPNRETRANLTGNAGMTVGGSGDVLAGFVTSLIAQHARPYEACKCSAFLMGLAGDNLYKSKGYNFIATDLAQELPYTIYSVIN